ncbi:MAG TPA: TolC family protein, partial [Pseudomonadales bacterium]|nr:TolC family protein [Pseudomonadales bacterium]
ASADTASAYASWLSYADRIKLQNEILSSDLEVLEIIKARVDAGAASELELAQQKSEVASTQASLIALEQQRGQTVYQLALLLGESPAQLNQQFAANRDSGLDTLHPDKALVLQPGAVLQHRPDIQQAEMQFKAAHYDVEAAKAALFPGVDLSASAIALFNPSAHATEWSVSVLAPLFDRGALNARREFASAKARESLANYKGVVLTAFKEVETALQGLDASNRRIEALQRAVAESQKAYQIAKQRYEAGAIDFETLLQTQRSLLQQTDNLAQAKLARIQALIDIYRSTGG